MHEARSVWYEERRVYIRRVEIEAGYKWDWDIELRDYRETGGYGWLGVEVQCIKMERQTPGEGGSREFK